MDAHESPDTPSEHDKSSTGHFDASRKRRHSECSDHPTREYGLMRDTGKNDTARFVGSGSGIHFIRSVYLRLVRKSALRSSRASHLDGDLVPGEDDQLQRQESESRQGRALYLWKAHETAPVGSTNAANVPFEQLVEWSKSYFEAWHPTLPFLSAPHVLALFEKISSSGVGVVGPPDLSIVKSIMSISLADSRQGFPFSQPVPSSLVFQTIEEAMAASQFALSRPASIQATQAALAIQTFLMSMLRLNSASRLGGLIVRMAYHLGLHRCPSRYPFFTQDEASMRRRVFWSIYCNERFLCQALGLPLDIRDDDVDVCYPGDERHGTSAESAGDNRLRLLTYLAKHARIRGLILELRNKAIRNRDDTAHRSSYVQAELTKWSNEIHDAVEEEGDEPTMDEDHDQQSPLSSGHRLFLLLLKYESMISLNRPMMTSGPTSPAYSAGLQNCVSAAKSILIAMKRYLAQHKMQNDTTSARLSEPMLQPSFTWTVWISSFILFYAASERQLPLASTLRHLDSGKNALRHIALRDISWPEYCLTAVDELTAAFRDLSTATHDPHRAPSSNQHNFEMQPPSNGPDSGFGRPRKFSDIGRRDSRPRASASPSMAESMPPPSESVSFPTEGLPWAQDSSGGFPGPPDASSRWATPPNPFDLNHQPSWLALAAGTFQSNEAPSGEGQESLVWYDQLFANSFGAIDSPALAEAQTDASVDPTWSYLR